MKLFIEITDILKQIKFKNMQKQIVMSQHDKFQ